MRAVNLIPSEQRGGGSVGAGRSGGAAYAVLALLGAVALLALLYGKASREVSSKQGQVTKLNAETQQEQAQASALAPYTSFVSLREQRAQAVAALVDSRFDWAHAFHEFGRVLSSQVSIASLDGTIAAVPASASPAAPSTTPTSGAAAASAYTSATPPGSVPTFQLAGCASSQDAVALMLQRLRLIDGVSEVTLTSSTKSASGGSTSAASSTGANGCTASDPTFAVSVTFDPLPTTAAASAAAKPKSAASTVADKSASGGAAG